MRMRREIVVRVLSIVLLVLAVGLGAAREWRHKAAYRDCEGTIRQLRTDWPQLNRYRDADQKAGLPRPGEDRVVFLGDSITEFWDLGKSFPGKPYINRGIGHQTTSEMLLRFRQDVIGLRPRAVIILAGTGDIAGNTGPMTLEEIEGNIVSMVELAEANHIRALVGSVLPVNDYANINTGRRSPRRIVGLNARLHEYCASGRCAYLDFFSPMLDSGGFLRRDLSADGLHPNAAGYKLMDHVVRQGLGERD